MFNYWIFKEGLPAGFMISPYGGFLIILEPALPIVYDSIKACFINSSWHIGG